MAYKLSGDRIRCSASREGGSFLPELRHLISIYIIRFSSVGHKPRVEEKIKEY
jgi:hypothetical protein